VETETETETEHAGPVARDRRGDQAAVIGPGAGETGSETGDRDRDRQAAEGRDRMSSKTETETAGRDRTAAARSVLAAQLTGRTIRVFYGVVLVVALVGSSTAAREWLLGDPAAGKVAPWWWLPAALVAVCVYELGAVAVSRFADHRRQLGERAIIARAASAALAGGAIAAQYLGHTNPGQAAFFAGVSATGYVIYLLESAANRRDALRRTGKLADTPPAYGWFQWCRHFWITRRARALALARAEARLLDKSLPPLGRVASLEAAADQVRAERRLAAIEDALRTRIAAGVDPTMAKIAVNTYDMGRVAAGIAAAADYPSLTRIITAELVPARLVKLGDAGDQAAAEAAAVTAAAAAITEHVAELAAVPPAPAGRPLVVPAGARQLPIVPAAAPVPAPVPPAPVPVPAAVPAPVPPVPPAAETGPARAEAAPATFRLEPLPPSLASILSGGQPAPLGAPAAPVPPAETAPVPAPPASETEALADPGQQAAGQGETAETDAETDAPETNDVLAAVEDKLLPLMLKVIDAHEDWATTVLMPPRHPDALNVPKIMAAAGTGSKAYGVAIGRHLRGFAANPETVETALRSRETETAGAR
jgi:hypothetical protein